MYTMKTIRTQEAEKQLYTVGIIQNIGYFPDFMDFSAELCQAPFCSHNESTALWTLKVCAKLIYLQFSPLLRKSGTPSRGESDFGGHGRLSS